MNQDIGKLILRVALGVVILFHGIAKLTTGIDFISETVTAHGLPGFVAYGAYVGEVVAPLLLILGFWSRIGGWLVAINMLFALWLVHATQIFQLNPQSGGLALEAQYLFLLSAVAVALIGPGRFSINDR